MTVDCRVVDCRVVDRRVVDCHVVDCRVVDCRVVDYCGLYAVLWTLMCHDVHLGWYWLPVDDRICFCVVICCAHSSLGMWQLTASCHDDTPCPGRVVWRLHIRWCWVAPLKRSRQPLHSRRHTFSMTHGAPHTQTCPYSQRYCIIVIAYLVFIITLVHCPIIIA